MSNGWSGRRSPTFILESRSLHVITHDRLVDMLRQHVRRGFTAWNLYQPETLFVQSVLDPQVSGGQVPDLPQSPSPCNSNGS